MKYLAYALSLLPIIWATVVSAQTTGVLDNPLNPNISSLAKFVEFALKALITVSLPIISFFIVYSGFLFVTARGNQEKLSTAKENFVYVVLGTILILGAWVIATIIGGTVSQLTS